jgi:hypothetical protein
VATARRSEPPDPWVAAMLEAMRTLAAGRERERAMKEMLYSSGKLGSRLAAKEEAAAQHLAEAAAGAAYLRRKAAQGKGGI